jgi:hypothetical protein
MPRGLHQDHERERLAGADGPEAPACRAAPRAARHRDRSAGAAVDRGAVARVQVQPQGGDRSASIDSVRGSAARGETAPCLPPSRYPSGVGITQFGFGDTGSVGVHRSPARTASWKCPLGVLTSSSAPTVARGVTEPRGALPPRCLCSVRTRARPRRGQPASGPPFRRARSRTRPGRGRSAPPPRARRQAERIPPC